MWHTCRSHLFIVSKFVYSFIGTQDQLVYQSFIKITFLPTESVFSGCFYTIVWRTPCSRQHLPLISKTRKSCLMTHTGSFERFYICVRKWGLAPDSPPPLTIAEIVDYDKQHRFIYFSGDVMQENEWHYGCMHTLVFLSHNRVLLNLSFRTLQKYI